MIALELKVATHLRAGYKPGFERGTRVIVSAMRLGPSSSGLQVRVDGLGWIDSWWTGLYRHSSAEARLKVVQRESSTDTQAPHA